MRSYLGNELQEAAKYIIDGYPGGATITLPLEEYRALVTEHERLRGITKGAPYEVVQALTAERDSLVAETAQLRRAAEDRKAPIHSKDSSGPEVEDCCVSLMFKWGGQCYALGFRLDDFPTDTAKERISEVLVQSMLVKFHELSILKPYPSAP